MAREKNKKNAQSERKKLSSSRGKRSNGRPGNKFTQKNKVLVGDPGVATKKNKKNRRLNYTQEDLANALKAVNSRVSLRKAASAYDVPAATLGRKKIDPDAIKQKTGPETILTRDEEEESVNWMLYRAERGMPVTKTELLDSAQRYVTISQKQTPFIDNRPSRHWYEGFRKRHPSLTVRKPQNLSLTRASVTQENLQQWFREQEEYLKKKDLLGIPPSNIFNCDETNIVLCPDSERVITERGSRSIYKIVDAGKESLTVLFMYTANGARAPPMLMYPYKGGVPKKIVENTPKDWGIGVSENGWMTTETFYEYMTNVFYPWLVQENIEFPVIVY